MRASSFDGCHPVSPRNESGRPQRCGYRFRAHTLRFASPWRTYELSWPATPPDPLLPTLRAAGARLLGVFRDPACNVFGHQSRCGPARRVSRRLFRLPHAYRPSKQSAGDGAWLSVHCLRARRHHLFRSYDRHFPLPCSRFRKRDHARVSTRITCASPIAVIRICFSSRTATPPPCVSSISPMWIEPERDTA